MYEITTDFTNPLFLLFITEIFSIQVQMGPPVSVRFTTNFKIQLNLPFLDSSECLKTSSRKDERQLLQLTTSLLKNVYIEYLLNLDLLVR